VIRLACPSRTRGSLPLLTTQRAIGRASTSRAGDAAE
jgi:hypothetical protein